MKALLHHHVAWVGDRIAHGIFPHELKAIVGKKAGDSLKNDVKLFSKSNEAIEFEMRVDGKYKHRMEAEIACLERHVKNLPKELVKNPEEEQEFQQLKASLSQHFDGLDRSVTSLPLTAKEWDSLTEASIRKAATEMYTAASSSQADYRRRLNVVRRLGKDIWKWCTPTEAPTSDDLVLRRATPAGSEAVLVTNKNNIIDRFNERMEDLGVKKRLREGITWDELRVAFYELRHWDPEYVASVEVCRVEKCDTLIPETKKGMVEGLLTIGDWCRDEDVENPCCFDINEDGIGSLHPKCQARKPCCWIRNGLQYNDKGFLRESFSDEDATIFARVLELGLWTLWEDSDDNVVCGPFGEKMAWPTPFGPFGNAWFCDLFGRRGYWDEEVEDGS